MADRDQPFLIFTPDPVLFDCALNSAGLVRSFDQPDKRGRRRLETADFPGTLFRLTHSTHAPNIGPRLRRANSVPRLRPVLRRAVADGGTRRRQPLDLADDDTFKKALVEGDTVNRVAAQDRLATVTNNR
jgi:hypothetical protein